MLKTTELIDVMRELQLRRFLDQLSKVVMWIYFRQPFGDLIDLAVDLCELYVVLVAIIIHKFLIILLDHLIMKMILLDLT